MNEKALKRSRLMYIFEAALEYFISLLVAGSFLATLTKEVGFSDGLTGILSSVISLGCLFQILSLMVRRKRMKRFVIFFSIINQLLFMFLYVVPITNFSKNVKIAIFCVLIFLAYLIYNLVHPKKINWLMSLVDDEKRGSFTANKEIFSLISGIIFTFVMGTVIDHFTESGNTRTAFVISAIVIFVIMVSHTLTMLFAVEKETEQVKLKKFKDVLFELVKNKNVLRVMIVFVLYNISTYVSLPFYGTYQIGELNLSLTFVAVITTGGSVARIFVSKFWGRYADENTFTKSIEKCFIVMALSQVCVIFAVPSTGKVMFALYYILNGIAMGGISSALINLIFDYVAVEDRADSLAVSQALAGVTGFLTTIAVSPLISYIQNNGNKLFGLPIYAQQFVTIIALIFIILAILYTRRMGKKN